MSQLQKEAKAERKKRQNVQKALNEANRVAELSLNEIQRMIKKETEIIVMREIQRIEVMKKAEVKKLVLQFKNKFL